MKHPFLSLLDQTQTSPAFGQIIAVNGPAIEADGPIGTIGEICAIECAQSKQTAYAQIVSTRGQGISLMALTDTVNLRPGDRATATSLGRSLPVGSGFAGRAVDALGQPIDGGLPIADTELASTTAAAVLRRRSPDRMLETGIKAIDGLLTLGEGQRIGIFAASGVGKTSLMDQIVRQISADRVVVCLVGERGREVSSLWGAAATTDAKLTLVASTSDESAVMRARAVEQALALACFWRARGEHVLLVVDSVTRYAMALREIGLAAGAPPTIRAYTPNVFAALPTLVERCGAVEGEGAITAVMTVLSETDEVDDPIVEIMKSLLDGHIVLSRRLAEKRHFPAIDVVRSVSRQAERLMESAQTLDAREALEMLSTYEENRVMIESGLYRTGASPKIDRCLLAREPIMRFLAQSTFERCTLAATRQQLAAAVGKGGMRG
ncbi:FliI/YscN family ATPase [Novosphingobium sp. AAP93]|uniref:FliI/YscN family ATPase n=1 Tax=Novosphingobium sp. AAP93 TaxID=1523427 RepID=UPI0006B97DA9|nr:FliI/YscN family ATPase [Novosphingobium sp. AAP93]KPF77586.1 flagellar protein FliI [Novosphingobium sp. AAP93]